MKITYRLIGSISALAGILLMILILINGVLIQEDFLNGTNAKYKVHKNISISEEELKSVVHYMIEYVKGRVQTPQLEVTIKDTKMDFYNEKELGHLEDVKNLLQRIYAGMWVMLLVFVLGFGYLFYKKKRDTIPRGIITACMFLGALALFIGVFALIDVNIVVRTFHEIFLSDSKWVLNPALDRSVWMFRAKMYKDVLFVLGIIVVAVVGGFLGIAAGIKRISMRKTKLP